MGLGPSGIGLGPMPSESAHAHWSQKTFRNDRKRGPTASHKPAFFFFFSFCGEALGLLAADCDEATPRR